MREVVLQISDEDFLAIERELVINGTTKNIKINITEAVFRESPKYNLERLKGELV